MVNLFLIYLPQNSGASVRRRRADRSWSVCLESRPCDYLLRKVLGSHELGTEGRSSRKSRLLILLVVCLVLAVEKGERYILGFGGSDWAASNACSSGVFGRPSRGVLREKRLDDGLREDNP